MKLNHESYEKAFSNITLDDRIGMELVSNAKVKRLRRKKKITSQVAAAIICLVLAGGAGTGICYAQTGTDPIHFFAMMFQHASMEAVYQVADGFVESDQSLTDGNVRVTLDSYFYDKEKGIIISNVTFSTIDGSDFYTKDEMDAYRAKGEDTDDEILRSMIVGDFGVDSGSSANTGNDAIMIENGHTFHYYAIITDMNGRKNASDQLVIRGNNKTGDTSSNTSASAEQADVSVSAEEEAKNEPQYEAGVWTDNVYTNTSLGMTFALPEGWQIGTEEEMNAVQDKGQEVTGDTGSADASEAYDLYIYNSSTGSNIAMMAEDMSAFGDITAQEYIESLSQQLSSYADQGITYTMNEIGTKTIGNTEFVSLDGIAEYQSNNIYQCYAVTEMGGKMITMIITGPADQGQAECEAVLASIQPIAQ